MSRCDVSKHLLSVLSAISVLVRLVVPLCNSSAHTGHLSLDVQLDVCNLVDGIATWLCSISCAMENQARAKILVYIYIYIYSVQFLVSRAGNLQISRQKIGAKS